MRETLREAARSYLPVVAFLAASYVFLRYLLPYLLPFVLAVFLALLVEPPVAWLERRWRIPRSLGAGVVILVLIVGLGFLLALGAVRLGSELLALSTSLPDFFRRLTDLADVLAGLVGQYSATLPPLLKQAIDQQLAFGYRVAQAAVGTLLTSLQAWVVALPGAVVLFLLTALATYFVSRDKGAIRDFLLGLLPAAVRPGAVEVKNRLLTSTIGLVKAQTILVTLTFLVFLAGLTLLKAPYALLAAVVSSLLDVLPVLGPALVFLPWAAYALAAGQTAFAVGLLVVYGSVALVRGALQASVIGGRIGLHPLATLVALYVGVKLFGAVGVVYGPLVAALLKAAVQAGLVPVGPGGSRR